MAEAHEQREPTSRRRQRLPMILPLGLALALGMFAGMGVYTFGYAEGLSYLSTDPKACVNCHIMQSQYDSWQKASHHAVAVCVDCHLPHSFIPKYIAKAENGWRHGKLFTTQTFAEPIVVQTEGMRILQENCIGCHGELVDRMAGPGEPGMSTHPAFADDRISDDMLCVHCHASVGHGERTGLGGPLRPSELRDLPAAEPAVSQASASANDLLIPGNR